LINLLEEASLCYSKETYRIPGGKNIEEKCTFRCTKIKRTHPTDPNLLVNSHYCNKELFSPDTSWTILTKWYTSLCAYFGYGYYPRWNGEFEPHEEAITKVALSSEFEKAIYQVFTMPSREHCLRYAAMLLKSLTNNEPIEIVKIEVGSNALKVDYCSICFSKGHKKLCESCKMLWDKEEITKDWQLNIYSQ